MPKKKILTTDNLSALKEINDYLYQTKLHSSNGSVILSAGEESTDIKINPDAYVNGDDYYADCDEIGEDLDNIGEDLDNIGGLTISHFNFYCDDGDSGTNIVEDADFLDNGHGDGYYGISINRGQPSLWRIEGWNQNCTLYSNSQGIIQFNPSSGEINLNGFFGDPYTNDDYYPEIDLYNGEIDYDNFLFPVGGGSSGRDLSDLRNRETKVGLYPEEGDEILATVSYDEYEGIIYLNANGKIYQFVVEGETDPR